MGWLAWWLIAFIALLQFHLAKNSIRLILIIQCILLADSRLSHLGDAKLKMGGWCPDLNYFGVVWMNECGLVWFLIICGMTWCCLFRAPPFYGGALMANIAWWQWHWILNRITYFRISVVCILLTILMIIYRTGIYHHHPFHLELIYRQNDSSMVTKWMESRPSTLLDIRTLGNYTGDAWAICLRALLV